MGEDWIREALAEQEEHIKRVSSCLDVVGRSHDYRVMGTVGEVSWQACSACGVTRTQDDFETRRRVEG